MIIVVMHILLLVMIIIVIIIIIILMILVTTMELSRLPASRHRRRQIRLFVSHPSMVEQGDIVYR